MKIALPSDVIEAIRSQAEAGYPHEICGFLLGAREGENDSVETALPAENTRAETRNRYLIDPLAYRDAEREADDAGKTLIAFYHSHPDAPARPSAYDLEHAWPWMTYVIVAVESAKAAEMTAWRMTGDRSNFESIELLSRSIDPASARTN